MLNNKLAMPKHIAMIMDGNRRWARLNSFSFDSAYKYATNAVEEAVNGAINLAIPYLSLFAFSSDNSKRDIAEVTILKKLIKNYVIAEAENLIKNNIKLKIIGNYHEFSKSIAEKLDDLITKTANNSKLTLTIALNYSGKDEITETFNNILLTRATNQSNTLITSKEINNNLITNYMPDPDILIRTGGEQRISNFFLWQLAYTELFFLQKLWPDFKEADLIQVVNEFKTRERRYGK